MGRTEARFVFWAVVAVVVFVVLRRIGIAALFGKPSSSADPTIFGGFGGGGGGDGGVTAPGVTPTPVGPTQATTHPSGDPVTTISGVDLYNISGRSPYIGAAGSKAADVTTGYATTPTSGGVSVPAANIPGLSKVTKTGSTVTITGPSQALSTADLTKLTDFHRNDANVIAQVAAEKSQVAPGQTYKFIGGYRSDGTPILIY